MKKWKSIETHLVFKTKRVKILRELITNVSQERYSTYIKQLNRGVCIIPYFSTNDAFLLVKQFRNPLKKEIWQFPSGGNEHQEALISTAKRELLEETGYTCENWVDLGEFHPDSELISTSGHFFLAIDPSYEKKSASVDLEETEFKVFAKEDLNEKILKGEIRDGWTLSALQLFNIWENQKSK